MTKTYRPYQPEQGLWLPPSLRDWLPENHLAYLVSDLVDQLDLAAIYAVYEQDPRGQPPYDPRLMTKLLVYGYCVGVFSARKIEQREVEEGGFRVLRAAETDDAEDRRYGKSRRGDELREELQRHETRQKRRRAAKKALEERAR